VKNNFAANEYRRLGSNMSILMQLIHNDGFGDWREINTAGARHQAVAASDVRRVVQKYFTKENRNVAIYTRKPARSGSSPDGLPDLTALSPEQQSAIRAISGSLKQEKDVGKLKTALSQMEEATARADEKMKAFLQAQKKLVEQRIEELK